MCVFYCDSKYSCTVAEARKAVEIGGHLLALRAMMGWTIGANELQICVILPHCLLESQFLVDVEVKGADGVKRTEKQLLGLGILGSMQGFEALHALTKVRPPPPPRPPPDLYISPDYPHSALFAFIALYSAACFC